MNGQQESSYEKRKDESHGLSCEGCDGKVEWRRLDHTGRKETDEER